MYWIEEEKLELIERPKSMKGRSIIIGRMKTYLGQKNTNLEGIIDLLSQYPDKEHTPDIRFYDLSVTL